MGIPVEIEFPLEVGLGSAATAALPLQARWEREAHFSVDHKRFLISLFAEDRPGILAAVLAALSDGVSLSGRSREPLRFSIDGSLAAAIHATFGAVFVAKIVTTSPSEVAFVQAVPDEVIRKALKEKLTESITGVGFEVWPFRHIPRDLFAGKRFSEYRFGVPKDCSQILSHIAKAFSSDLGDLQIPIAYLQFPDSSVGDDKVWLRIGLGFERDLSDSVDADLRALNCAARHGAALSKYDPSVKNQSIPGRFRSIVVEDREGLICQSSQETEEKPEIVFVEGPAEPGYVARMLKLADSEQVLGGNMAVLAGHTMATWVTRSGFGQRFSDELEAVTRAQYADAPLENGPQAVRSDVIQAGDEAVGPSPDVADLWICWRCGERAGILREVVDALARHFDSLGVQFNVEREVSRVLAEGDTCAGKIRVTVPTSVARSESRTELARVIEAALAPALAGWAPRRSHWLLFPVLVERDEPAEDPWAYLHV